VTNAGADWMSRARALRLSVRDFVEGGWRPECAAPSIEKYGPRDGRLLYTIGSSGSKMVNEAVAVARRAFEDGRWSRLPLERRKEVLYRLAGLIEQHREEFALRESLDVGKPVQGAYQFDVPVSAARLRTVAEGAEHVYGKVFAVDASNLSYQLRRPVGVVGGVVGWNFPLMLAIEKIGPVLAMGNCLVLKPSELTSLSAARVAELAMEAGLPEGVLNVVHGGPTTGAALAEHPDIDLLTFTGSSRTGKALLVAAGQSNMKRLVLECGGKAPNIVFDDCPDLEAAAEAIVARAFWNQGEVCTASSRLLVQDGIHAGLLQRVVERLGALKPGDPLDARTTFGALVSEGHRKKVTDYVRGGKESDARVLYESNAPAPLAGGFYLPPVIFDQVSPETRIAREEIFGPVLSVIRFRDEEEALQIANATIYGLSAILWTRDLGRAHRMSHNIRAGWIVVNATGRPAQGPGGGVLSIGGLKQSGIGVEGGIEGLTEYTSTSTVQMFV